MERLKIALDCDDVLYDCCGYALAIKNEEFGLDMTMEERTGWGVLGNRTDCVLPLFAEPDFFAGMPVYPGAQEFVKKLSELADVYIMTAVDPQCMGVRASRIIHDFPQIDPGHIILGSPKNLLQVDVLLDDAMHNILSSPATYPVLMRKPWNREMSGSLSVETYEEFLSFIRTLLKSESRKADFDQHIYCFVGPSGSGKTAIIEKIAENPDFEKVKTTTTRARRDGESNEAYRFVTKKQFNWMKEEGLFLETTVYGGEMYGTTTEAILDIFGRGHDALIAIDIAGAISVKSQFGDAAKLIFVDRPKKEILKSILKRTISNDEKATRILSLDSEDFNERFCDTTIRNRTTIEAAVEQFETFAEEVKNK